MTTNVIQPTTHTLDVPGATLTYDVRRYDASTEPVLLLIGSPMGAAGFATLSRHFSDRTVVTYDPRGSERSLTTDPTSPVTPDVHADATASVRVADLLGDVSLVLDSAFGATKITGETFVSVIHRNIADFPPLHQGGARYTWDGEDTYGMIERSYPSDEMTW